MENIDHAATQVARCLHPGNSLRRTRHRRGAYRGGVVRRCPASNDLRPIGSLAEGASSPPAPYGLGAVQTVWTIIMRPTIGCARMIVAAGAQLRPLTLGLAPILLRPHLSGSGSSDAFSVEH